MKIDFYRKGKIAFCFLATLVFISFNLTFVFIAKNHTKKKQKAFAEEIVLDKKTYLFESTEAFTRANSLENFSQNNACSSNKADYSEAPACTCEEENKRLKANQIISNENQITKIKLSENPEREFKERTAFTYTCKNSVNHNAINKKIKVFVSGGIAPVFFKGNSFIDNFFFKQKTFFLPCLTLSFVSNAKTGWNWGILLQGTGSKFEHSIINYSFNQNLLASTQFYTIQAALLFQRDFFSNKNLFEIHAGIGITGFTNSYCKLGDNKCPPANSTNIFLNCGLSLKHNFSKSIFCNITLDFNYAISPTKAFIFLTPTITGGVLI